MDNLNKKLWHPLCFTPVMKKLIRNRKKRHHLSGVGAGSGAAAYIALKAPDPTFTFSMCGSTKKIILYLAWCFYFLLHFVHLSGILSLRKKLWTLALICFIRLVTGFEPHPKRHFNYSTDATLLNTVQYVLQPS
jgi:hypothetical protein